jgi:hypothetical protein
MIRLARERTRDSSSREVSAVFRETFLFLAVSRICVLIPCGKNQERFGVRIFKRFSFANSDVGEPTSFSFSEDFLDRCANSSTFSTRIVTTDIPGWDKS